MNHSAKSAQRKVKKFTSHTVACKLRRISGGSVSLVRSGLNVRLLKRPIQFLSTSALICVKMTPALLNYYVYRVHFQTNLLPKQILIVSLLGCCCSSSCTRLYHKETECCKRLRIWVWRIRRCCNT